MASSLGQIGLVAAGGAIGALLRFGISSGMVRLVGERFPWGTLLVNAAGCLAIGLIIGWFESRRDLPESVRLLLVVGLLGSLTTFSTFAGDTLVLAREGRLPAAALNIAANLALGFALAALGWWITRPGLP
ncbi:MAG: fluoride efflux transporter CrcB [Phycisphaerales bacterium JB037]